MRQGIQVCERTGNAISAGVRVLHVVAADPSFAGYDAGPDVVRDQVTKAFCDKHRGVQAHAETLRQAGLETNALLLQGRIVETILAEAKKTQTDLLIVGFGMLYGLVIGSSSRGILKDTKIPVLVD